MNENKLKEAMFILNSSKKQVLQEKQKAENEQNLSLAKAYENLYKYLNNNCQFK